MKKITGGLFAVLLLWGAASPPAWAGPAIEHWTRAEGGEVYFVAARELPIVDLELTFPAGSVRDGDLQGLATLVADMMLEGTAELDAEAIAAGFENLGVEVQASANRESASIQLRSLADDEHLEPALALLGKVLAGASFPDNAFQRAKRNRLLSLRQEQEKPASIAERAFYSALYGAHPYANPPSGTEAAVTRLERADLVGFRDRYYVASNALVSLVGDLDRQRADEIAATLLAHLPTGAAVRPLPQVAEPDKGHNIAIDHPSTQTHLRLGHPALARRDPDFFPLYVGNHILGGSGLVSKIFLEIREKHGLAYSAYSYFFPMQMAGPFVIGMETRNDQTDQALGVLDQVLREFIEKGPSEADLRDAKRNISGGFPLRLDSNKKILAYLSMIGFYQLPLDYLDTFVAKVEAVTAEQIRAAFQQRVKPENLVRVTVGGAAPAGP